MIRSFWLRNRHPYIFLRHHKISKDPLKMDMNTLYSTEPFFFQQRRDTTDSKLWVNRINLGLIYYFKYFFFFQKVYQCTKGSDANLRKHLASSLHQVPNILYTSQMSDDPKLQSYHLNENVFYMQLLSTVYYVMVFRSVFSVDLVWANFCKQLYQVMLARTEQQFDKR